MVAADANAALLFSMNGFWIIRLWYSTLIFATLPSAADRMALSWWSQFMAQLQKGLQKSSGVSNSNKTSDFTSVRWVRLPQSPRCFCGWVTKWGLDLNRYMGVLAHRDKRWIAKQTSLTVYHSFLSIFFKQSNTDTFLFSSSLFSPFEPALDFYWFLRTRKKQTTV